MKDDNITALCKRLESGWATWIDITLASSMLTGLLNLFDGVKWVDAGPLEKYKPELEKYIDGNSLGNALLIESTETKKGTYERSND